MQLDGEWRLGMAKDAGVGFEIGTRRCPSPTTRWPRYYGKGFLSGTVMGIAPHSRKRENAAWELVKYMTTDTEAVVAFANAIRNVPSTFPAPQVARPEDRPGVSRPSWTSPSTPSRTPRRPPSTAPRTS
ncbi:hypothetical protein STENM327S_02324 [Streptomyces tendae]